MFPPKWTEINAGEFARKFALGRLIRSEYRQMRPKDNMYGLALMATLFFFSDDTGVAVQHISVFDKTTYNNKSEAKFYSFGCKHNMELIQWDEERFGPKMNCDHAYACSECGYTEVINSSD